MAFIFKTLFPSTENSSLPLEGLNHLILVRLSHRAKTSPSSEKLTGCGRPLKGGRSKRNLRAHEPTSRHRTFPPLIPSQRPSGLNATAAPSPPTPVTSRSKTPVFESQILT